MTWCFSTCIEYIRQTGEFVFDALDTFDRRGPSMKRRLLAAGVAAVFFAGGVALWSRQRARGYP